MKVGDYVRTDYGLIGKIFEKYRGIQNATIYKVDVPNEDFDYTNIFKFEIVKSSPNIIDLIEVGDLVYVDISPDDCGGIIVPRITETERELNSLKLLIENKDYILKSIITHEQIESMEYIVKE